MTRLKQLLRNTKQLQKKLKSSWISTDRMAFLTIKDSMERKVYFLTSSCMPLFAFF
jgi:hypothetical protein